MLALLSDDYDMINDRLIYRTEVWKCSRAGDLPEFFPPGVSTASREIFPALFHSALPGDTAIGWLYLLYNTQYMTDRNSSLPLL